MEPPTYTPAGFVDPKAPTTWWGPANTVAAFARALEIHLCSYRAENDGHLFVHLVPAAGDTESAQKSRKSMRGHTDASALPLPGEQSAYASVVGPSPDLVILVGIRNPAKVETKIAPLSVVMRKLSATTIEALKEPIFDFTPQSSFEMSSSYCHSRRPVILRDQYEGYMIRFSHSRVQPSVGAGDRAAKALAELKAALEGSFQPVTLQQGDVLFVNNRTALHGRANVGEAKGTQARWLLRVYGMYSYLQVYPCDSQSPFMLLPDKGGPTEQIMA
jgi:hypothetical protein